MSRASVQQSPQVKRAPLIADVNDYLVQLEIERGSEAYPGCRALQQAYDEYLDAIHLAKHSGRHEDTITAGKLYLRYARARDEADAHGF